MADNDSDELCEACVKFDLYSFFSGLRYYPSEGTYLRKQVTYRLNTLQHVIANHRCPLCRLIKHEVYGPETSSGLLSPPNDHDPAKIQVSLIPIRVDENETDAKYVSAKTRAMLATRVAYELSGKPGCSPMDYIWINNNSQDNNSAGIQLLSPDVAPYRPLLNGFRASTMQNSLKLLSQWIETCHEHHKETCGLRQDVVRLYSRLDQIRLIHVLTRELIEHDDPGATEYATLSYVWGQDTDEYTKLADRLRVQQDVSGNESVFLPPDVPKVIEDALFVCRSISIPYLWVDLYCVHQKDLAKKLADINAMGQIYQNSHITLIAGLTSGLLGPFVTDDLGSKQRIETIGGRKYIYALPSVISQIRSSAWSKRGWTYQEGQMAKRIAFFG
jgi:hypothetical protein